MPGQPQEPVTFEDVTVFLSRAEWDALLPGQRELYRDVVSDTYELLTSLGYPGPKPDILHRLERGEEPWICPSPGHAGNWLEEPSCGLWPGAGGCQGLEEGLEPLGPAGQSTVWCLQATRLPEFGCLEGRSEFLWEADSGVGSQAQPWLVKEEVEDKPELMESLAQSEPFLLHSMTEEQNVDLWEQPFLLHSMTEEQNVDLWEQPFLLHSMTEEQSMDLWEQLWEDPGESSHENAPSHGHTAGEAAPLPGRRELRVEELRAAVAKDHSYSLRSELGAAGAARPCSPWEHNYCQQRRAGRARGAGAARALLRRRRRSRRRLRSRHGTVLRTARDILRRYRPYRGLRFPWRGCSGCCAAAQGTNPAASPPTAAPCDPRSAGNAEGVTPDTPREPEEVVLRTGASPPAPIPAARARKGATLLEELGGRVESLQDVFRDVLKVIAIMLDYMCQKFELQGFSQGKNIWPIIIQIDNLAEVEKP